MKRREKSHRENIEYFFSVEGQCERLYLSHLQDLINQSNPKYTVSLHSKICTSPISYFKREPSPVEVYTHIWDRESEDNSAKTTFQRILKEIKDVSGKKMVYAGYSHLTFELWIILHKKRFNKSIVNKNDYLKEINKLYKTNFSSHTDYTDEKKFTMLLEQIQLDDVLTAIDNAHYIRTQNENNGKESTTFNISKNKKIVCYNHNPDLLIHEVLEQIFRDCKLM